MSRPDLQQPPVLDRAAAKMTRYHSEIVDEVRAAVAANDVVVVGMGWNRHCRYAIDALDEAGVPHVYLQYGNYANMWKERLALKLWSGWPTFPQVYLKGALVGGAAELKAALEAGEVQAALAGELAS